MDREILSKAEFNYKGSQPHPGKEAPVRKSPNKNPGVPRVVRVVTGLSLLFLIGWATVNGCAGVVNFCRGTNDPPGQIFNFHR